MPEDMPVDRLAALRGKAPATEKKPEDVLTKKPYVAFEKSPTELRFLQLRYPAPTLTEAVAYPTITGAAGERILGLSMTLTIGANREVIYIKGENLTEIYDSILEWKVRYIQSFDPRFHIKPTDKDAVFVESISAYDSAPPPKEKRH